VKRRRFSVEQIVAVLKQAEVGVPVAEFDPPLGITQQSKHLASIIAGPLRFL
jgi:putative transposase